VAEVREVMFNNVSTLPAYQSWVSSGMYWLTNQGPGDVTNGSRTRIPNENENRQTSSASPLLGSLTAEFKRRTTA